MPNPSSDAQEPTDRVAPPAELTISDLGMSPISAPGPTDAVQDAAMMDRIAGRLFGESEAEIRVGRFVLGAVVGSGAMGVVHAAYDETLDRTVAIKLILEERTQSEEAQSRLLQEARAMARVSHANVVPVYEAGTYPGGVFVAMEFVQGSTLRVWLRRNADRPWSEKMALLLGAGRGLAAAHREGIVHRDFKPDNVMVTERDEPKVGDFGLAGLAAAPPSASQAEGQSAPASLTTLTRTGAVVGTPVYMPPERFEAKPATPRSDQFAFCVVVFEALFGERPFGGKTASELAANVLEGNVRGASSSSGVPRYVKAAVLRGLATDPDARWPSMDALLVALQPRRHRGTWLVVGVAGAVGAAGLSVSLAKEPPCQGAQAHMDGVWDASRRSSLQDAFDAVGTAFAKDVWMRTAPRIDDYSEAWVEAHTRNCEMTRVSAEQSEAVMDLRMACLRRAKLGFAASLEVLSTPDADVVPNAHRLVNNLPDLQGCADVDALQRGGAPPSDADAEAVERVVALVATSRALEIAGKFDEALAAGTQARDALADVGEGPVATEVALAIGKAQLARQEHDAAEREFLGAQESAMRHGQWGRAVEAMGLAAFTIGGRGRRFEEANLTLALAVGLADRVGTPQTIALLDSRRAGVLSNQGRYDDAVAVYTSSLQRWDGSNAVGSEGRPGARRSLAITLKRLGKYDEAREQMRQVLRAQISAVGPQHPQVAQAHQTLAGILVEQGRLDEAEVEFASATRVAEATMPGHPEVAILQVTAALVPYKRGDFAEAARRNRALLAQWESKLAPDHEALVSARNNLAGSLLAQGLLDEAVPLLRDTVETRRTTFGDDHPSTVRARSNLAEVLLGTGDLEGAEAEVRYALEAARERDPASAQVGKLHGSLGAILAAKGSRPQALVEYEAGRDLLVAALGPDHRSVASMRNNLGEFYLEEERYGDAGRELSDALRIMELSLPADHPSIAVTLQSLARVDMVANELSTALPKLERAVQIHETNSSSPGGRGAARLALARCLSGLGRDKARIATLARAALDDYAEAPAPLSQLGIAEVKAFMTKHHIAR